MSRRWAILAFALALLIGDFGLHFARATEQFANTAQSTISNGGGYSSGATSIVLASTSSFPSSGNFRIKIGSEILLATANNTGTKTLTVTRGQESTTAAAISNGATVTHVLTAGALGVLKTDAFTAGGDLSGSATSQTVAKANGATVPAAGSLTTGNTLYVSGSSALSYGALNLAGGANFVTGAIPLANQNFAVSAIASTVDETTNSTTYVQLATTTDSVTATTGTTAFLCYYASTYNAGSAANTAYVSIAVSGATTLAAADSMAVTAAAAKASAEMPASRCLYLTGLTAGSNNFLMKYRVDGSTYHFFRRNLTVQY